MFLIKVENVSVEINGNILLENINMEVKESERIALVGDNGVGKTTLLKVLKGEVPYQNGNIQFHIKDRLLGWMLEDTPSTQTVREYVEYGNESYYRLKEQLRQATIQLEQKADEPCVLKTYQQALESYLEVDGYSWEVEVEQVLKQLHVPKQVWDNSFQSLSGGQKTRARLARLLMKKPQLLILDEPTNHLDMESVKWLSQWLKEYDGTVLFVSHERSFIDEVATVTIELTSSGTRKYHGGYSFYKEQKNEELKAKWSLYEKQEKERKKLIEAIQMIKQWHNKAKDNASVRDPYAQKKAGKQAEKYKAKEKILERLEKNRVEKPKEEKKVRATFEGGNFSAKHMIAVEKVSFGYKDSARLFSNVSLYINGQDRIAVVGRNGSGKTTLLKLLTGQLESSEGKIMYHPSLKIGYFMQELEGLQKETTILEEIMSIPRMTETKARTILACFLFRKEDVYQKIANLSMGEKCRVAFVKLYFSEANLLVMDEPTNYLDIATREQIEEALAVYEGAIIIVSHDPYLLRKVANRVISIEDGKVEDYLGSYQDWEQHEKVGIDSQNAENEKIRLQLEIATLMSEELETEEEQEKQLEKIKELKKQLDKR